MKLYSTNNHNNIVDLREAVLDAFPIDRGLYLPCEIPILEKGFFKDFYNQSFQETAYAVCRHLFLGAIEEDDLEGIIYRALCFPIIQKNLSEQIAVLELFHGPSLAFKDFGARFMAELMSHFLQERHEKRTILVATSGDTGGAVAAGFHGVDNIDVIILYPSGRVSPLQELQLTTWGSNIKAIEVDGSFDDCQSIVKDAFLDNDLKGQYTFSSANSINIARLIPQSFYFFEALKRSGAKELSISVPSGNFGNITAGILASRMGLEIKHFIAANNINRTFVDYYHSGVYTPKPSERSISNAMDVGDPSNFPRLYEMLGSTWNNVKGKMKAYSYTDKQTCDCINNTYKKFGYIVDPHTSVGILAAKEYLKGNKTNVTILSTAHPSKFEETIFSCVNIKPKLPKELSQIIQKDKQLSRIPNSFDHFKQLLMFT